MLPRRLSKYIIRTRNRKAIKGLRRVHGPHLRSNDDIDIFCVSNTIYWSNRWRPAEQARPHLELSGILAMRRHCLSIVATAQTRAAKMYIENEVQNVLSSIDLWVQSGARQSSE